MTGVLPSLCKRRSMLHAQEYLQPMSLNGRSAKFEEITLRNRLCMTTLRIQDIQNEVSYSGLTTLRHITNLKCLPFMHL